MPDIPEQALPDEAPQNVYGKDNAQLPEQLVKAIRAAIVEFQGQEKFSRRREVMRDRRNRFYEAGFQHISWNNQQGAYTLASPGATISNSAGQSVQCPTYIDDYNIFFPYLRILTSVLTQNPPGVNFQPIDPSISEDIDKAKAAEDYAHAFDRQNDTPAIQAEIVRMMGLSGRTVSWTRTEEDGQRFGYDVDGKPKSFQRTTIHGTLETKVPITAREFDRNVPYVFIYDDPDIKIAKTDYPDFADKIKAGSDALGESKYERTARLGVLNGTRNQAQTGDSLTHLVSRVNAFLRPAAFTGEMYENLLEQPEEGDVSPEGGVMTVKEKLDQLFPEGVRAVFVGDQYVGSFAESMDDHIEIQFPYQGDGMSRQPFMDSMVVVQDGFNDDMNWCREKFDTGAGSLWVRGTQEEIDAVTSQRAAPNAIRAAKQFGGNGDRPISDGFFKEDDPNLPPTLMEFISLLQNELPQFMLAAPPAIFGAAMDDAGKTASGYAQARSQAMGQLGIIWSRIQRMFARIRYQSALAASVNDAQTGEMTIPGKGGQQNLTVNLDRLKKGNFGCYPDEDGSFPESTQQKRATFGTVVTLAAGSPMVAQMLDNPDNLALAKRMWGLDELVLLPAEARNKQLFEIEILLAQDPIPPSPEELQAAQVQHAADSIIAKGAGQPEAPAPDPTAMLKSSVPVDELDYHQWEFEKCQEWLSSAARRTEDQKGNQAGVLNVKLHALEHRQYLMQMAAQMAAAQQPAEPAPAGKGGPPKKPPAQAGPPAAPAAPAAATI